MLYDPNWTIPEVKVEPWQEIILKSIELIETYGWVQKAFGSKDVGFCIVGAVRAIRPSPSTVNRLGYTEAWTHLMYGFKDRDIATWNDAPGRTKEEVILKLKEIARVV
jgi:hypothetical protein